MFDEDRSTELSSAAPLRMRFKEHCLSWKLIVRVRGMCTFHMARRSLTWL